MSTLDLIVLAALVILTVRGAFRGGIAEMIETVGTIGAALLTYRLYPTIAGVFRLPTGGSILELLGGFLIVFLGISICLALLGYWLKRLLQKIRLGTFDRLVGGILGFVKGAVIVTAIAWCLNWMGGEGKQLLDRSPIAKAHLEIAQVVWGSFAGTDDDVSNVI